MLSPPSRKPRVSPVPAGAIAALWWLVPAAFAQQRTPIVAELTGTFRSPLITESSGVAASRRFPGVLWTHNDSGDDAIVYATDLAGDDLGRYLIPGARNQDWEDIALARCPDQPRDCLYVADTGDNHEHRKHVILYIVPEPETRPTSATPREAARVAPGARSVRVRYPDRPRDVEAIWINPDGSVELVSKGISGPIVRYLIPLSGLKHTTVTAEVVDTLPIVPQLALGRLVTGAAISPSGRRVVIRTYTEVYLFLRKDDRHLSPDGPACWLGPLEPQGEGVAFLDEDTLVLTSEGARGRPSPIHRLKC